MLYVIRQTLYWTKPPKRRSRIQRDRRPQKPFVTVAVWAAIFGGTRSGQLKPIQEPRCIAIPICQVLTGLVCGLSQLAARRWDRTHLL